MQFAEKPSIIVKRPFDSKSAVGCAFTGGRRQRLSMSEPASGFPASAPLVVLDTNVVLDLWLFDDARSTPLRQALDAGALTALVTAPMLAELADVLQRPFAQGWPIPPAAALANLKTCARLVEPSRAAGPPVPRCTDPDDQKFIDLAWHWPAAWLVSRDRAVLRLAKPSLARGLRIVTPERWAALNTPA
ncbi:hypothetical protein AQPW35_49740 [Rubrivivax pictus]|uniref:PIN domain-containing protein n=2 Tax=Pseudaquabacterium pictum TaxID=2315236 RepID=A0A480AX31_9BURK|nr:hypothetical protein AQPW35_49740 [Rubrivivax pictus]